MSFKKGFYWGGATAANQCEGAWNIKGKGDSISDHLTSGSLTKGRIFTEKIEECYYYPSHSGIDMYHHYIEDIKLFKEMGFTMYRLSINWTRLYPTGEELVANKEGVQFYRTILEELKKQNIEPLVTISHFEMPYHLAEKYHGWAGRETIDCYLRFCKTLFEEYKDYVKYWIPFNEINNGANAFATYLSLGIPLKDKQCMMDGINETKAGRNEQYTAIHHQFVASAKAVLLGKSICPDYQFGCMLSGRVYYPHTCHPNDSLYAQQLWQNDLYFFGDVLVRGSYPAFTKRMFKEKDIHIEMDEEDLSILKQGTVDFFSFSYYSSSCVSADPALNVRSDPIFKGVQNPYLKVSDWGWAIDAKGLQYFLNDIYGRYQIPMMIVENGLGAYDELTADMKVHDDYRIAYLNEHVKAMKNAIKDGVDLIAYTWWGCIDIISASTGEMDKRYGFIYVNKDNQGSGDFKRYKKDSFYWYKKIIETNGKCLDEN